MSPLGTVGDGLFGPATDVRVKSARLAALLYTMGAATLLASVRFLPSGASRDGVTEVALLALASTVPVLLVPWRRLPLWTTALPLTWGMVLIALVGRWGSALEHFTLFYGLSAVYVGLTQARGSWVWVLPLNVASALLALSGSEPTSQAVDLLGAAVLAVLIGEVLAASVARTEEASRSTRRLLGAVSVLQQAPSEHEAANQVAALASTLLTPDVALVMAATDPGSPVYVNRGQYGVDDPPGSLVLDVSALEPIRQALERGRPVFLSAAQQSPLASWAQLAQLQILSWLFVPLAGEADTLGCLVLGWRASRSRLSRHEADIVDAVADSAGPLLARLRSVRSLTEQALSDPLTGLPNRRAFLHALDQIDASGAVVFLDLDHFKELNDTYGHQAGDDVLVAFGAALRHTVRAGDCAARYGGEEFALVLPDLETAHATVARLRDTWTGAVTFSAGVARHRPGDAPSTTLARADEALYRAKAAGRNTLVTA